MQKSIHQTVYGIFTENPDEIFTTADIQRGCKEKYGLETRRLIISNILTRLNRKKLIIRTPTQLKDGYHYSQQNKTGLDAIYEKHLIPSELVNKDELIENLTKNLFESLTCKAHLEPIIIHNSDFANKYSKEHICSAKSLKFLSVLVGFIMCDGHLCRNLTHACFFFRRETDAQQFIVDCKCIFKKETFILRPNNVGKSFTVQPRNSSQLAAFLHSLGAPKGNKTKKAFIIPDWIYNGPDEIKRSFLSTVIGNEGSAPSNRKWRIQFVLSKSEQHITNLVYFLNQIRSMLNYFGISTSHIQLRKQPGRQFHGRFYIKGERNLQKFYKQFEFSYASEKQEVLEDLMHTKPLRSVLCDDLVNTR